MPVGSRRPKQARRFGRAATRYSAARRSTETRPTRSAARTLHRGRGAPRARSLDHGDSPPSGIESGNDHTVAPSRRVSRASRRDAAPHDAQRARRLSANGGQTAVTTARRCGGHFATSADFAAPPPRSATGFVRICDRAVRAFRALSKYEPCGRQRIARDGCLRRHRNGSMWRNSSMSTPRVLLHRR
jgi:hypothetical protein